MDEEVVNASQRWSGVAPVYGWLRLDSRGRWRLIRRDRADFDSLRDAQGDPISSPGLIDFIGRNYAPDAEGAWYWQNGPQRVYVALETAPLIYRVLERRDAGPGRALVAHTGYRAECLESVWIDPGMQVFVRTELGPGMVHDQDLALLDMVGMDEPWTGSAASLGGKSPATLRWTDLHGHRRSIALQWTEDAALALGFVCNPQAPTPCNRPEG